MKTKWMAALLLSLTLTGAAMADGAPEAQFGYSGWPYRQSTDSMQTAATAAKAVHIPFLRICPVHREPPCHRSNRRSVRRLSCQGQKRQRL